MTDPEIRLPLHVHLLFVYSGCMIAKDSSPVVDASEKHTCLRKLRHADFLTAVHHARRIDDGDIHVYSCEFCGGLHVGHQSSTPTPKAKLLRNTERLERAWKEMRANRDKMKPATRKACEQRIRDLTRRKAELEAEVNKGPAEIPGLPPQLDGWGLLSMILINMGVWLQHLGCDCAGRSKRPWEKLRVPVRNEGRGPARP